MPKVFVKSWLVVQNLRIALSRVFISLETFRLTLIKKDCQNGKQSKGREPMGVTVKLYAVGSQLSGNMQNF